MADTAPIFLVDQEGQTVELRNPADLAAARRQGYTLATQDDIAKFKQEEKYGGTGGELAAAGLGAARAATFGASDWVARGLGMSAEDLEGYRQANPMATTAGEVAGVAGSLLIPGGALAKGAEGALTGAKALAPVAQASRMGQVIAHGVEAALPTTESLVGRIAKHAISQGAGLATEGAAYGMGHEVTEAALGDPNQTASSVIQHIGLSALLGGTLGGVFGAAEGALMPTLEKAGQGISNLQKTLDEKFPGWIAKSTGLPDDYAQAVYKARASTEEEAAAALRDAVRDPNLMGPRARAPEPVAPKRPPLVDPEGGWAREVSKGLQETHEAMESAAKQGAKIRPVEIATQLPAEVDVALAGQKMTEAHDLVQQFANTVADNADDVFTKAWGQRAQKAADKLLTAIEGGDPVEQYQALMKARQMISELGKPGKNLADMLDRDAVRAARKVADELRDAVTDVPTWGESAVRTAKFNIAKSEHDFDAKLFRKYFIDKETGLVDPGKAAKYLAKLDDPAMDKVRDALDGYLRSASAYKDAIAESARNAGMDFNADALTRVTNKSGELLRQARQSVANDRAFAEQQLAHEAAMKEFAANDKLASQGFEMAQRTQEQGIADAARRLSSTPDRTMGWFETGMLARGLGMIPGVGPALKMGVYSYKLAHGAHDVSVTSTIGYLSKLEEIAKKLDGSIKRGADGLIRGGSRVGTIGRAETEAGIGRYHGETEADQRAIYKRLMEHVNRLSDPDIMLEHLNGITQELTPHAPNTSGALQTKVAIAANYLKQNSPTRDPVALLDKPKEPSSTEVAKFLRRAEAIDNPTSLIKKAANGTLTKEHVEAVQAVHPELWATIQQAVLDAKAGYKGIVPRRAHQGLGLLIGQPVTISRNAQSLQTTAGLYQSVGQSGPQAPNPTASKASKLSVAQRTAEGTTSQSRQNV